jgi:hypothetical protein
MFSKPEIIYRVVGTLTPKSVSLYKDGDYQTGLSFLEWNPGGQTIRFRISRLIATITQSSAMVVNRWSISGTVNPISSRIPACS